MRNESIGVIDQEESFAQLLETAERELSSFVIAVNQLFDAEKGLKAANNWIEELERTNWPSDVSGIDWRSVTIAAAARLATSVASRSSKVREDIHAPINDPPRSVLLKCSHP